jgi:hypothetical protein
MNKKAYQQPQLHSVNIRVENLMGSTSITRLSSNAGFNENISGGSGDARSRGYDDDWDDWDDWE